MEKWRKEVKKGWEEGEEEEGLVWRERGMKEGRECKVERGKGEGQGVKDGGVALWEETGMEGRRRRRRRRWWVGAGIISPL